MKKFILLLTILIMLLLPATTYATTFSEMPNLKITVDGTNVNLENDLPIIVNDRTLVPLRKLLIGLGVPNTDGNISWNGETQEVKIIHQDKAIELKINSNIAYVNENKYELDQPPILYNSRTYLPARFIGEALDYNVDWDAQTPAVIINKEKKLLTIVKDGKYGVIDEDANEILACNYDYLRLHYYTDELIIAKQNNKIGLFNRDGLEILPFEYDSIGYKNSVDLLEATKGEMKTYTNIDKSVFFTLDKNMSIHKKLGSLYWIKKENKYGAINGNGIQVVPYIYENMSLKTVDGLIAVEKDNKYGYINENGNEIIPCEYDYLYEFSEGFAMVGDSNKKYSYIDKNNNPIVPYIYSSSSKPFKNGYATVVKDYKFGMINSSGKEVIPCTFNYMLDYSEGLICVYKDNKYGYIDINGNEIIPFKYDVATNFINGFAQVKINDKYGLIDKKGNEIIPCEYDYFSFNEGINDDINDSIQVSKNGTIYCVGWNGNLYPYNRYDAITFLNNIWFASSGDCIAFFDNNDNELFPFTNFNINFREFSDGLLPSYIRVENETKRKYGVFNLLTLKQIVPSIYDNLGKITWTSDLIAVERNGKWGYVNKEGKEIISFSYDTAGTFNNGLAPVSLNGKSWYINENGKKAFSAEYDSASDFIGTIAYVSKNNKYGLIDTSGKLIFQFEYDSIAPLEN